MADIVSGKHIRALVAFCEKNPQQKRPSSLSRCPCLAIRRGQLISQLKIARPSLPVVVEGVAEGVLQLLWLSGVIVARHCMHGYVEC